MRGGRIGQFGSRFSPIEQILEKGKRERSIRAIDQARLDLLNRLSEVRATLECFNSASAEKQNSELIAGCREEMRRLQEGIKEMVDRLRRLGAEWV